MMIYSACGVIPSVLLTVLSRWFVYCSILRDIVAACGRALVAHLEHGELL